jgi:hypothetical protein
MTFGTYDAEHVDHDQDRTDEISQKVMRPRRCEGGLRRGVALG